MAEAEFDRKFSGSGVAVVRHVEPIKNVAVVGGGKAGPLRSREGQRQDEIGIGIKEVDVGDIGGRIGQRIDFGIRQRRRIEMVGSVDRSLSEDRKSTRLNSSP